MKTSPRYIIEDTTSLSSPAVSVRDGAFVHESPPQRVLPSGAIAGSCTGKSFPVVRPCGSMLLCVAYARIVIIHDARHGRLLSSANNYTEPRQRTLPTDGQVITRG